jgi:hypothetical protein
MDDWYAALARPLRVELPVQLLRRPARAVSMVLLVVLMTGGVALAVVAAVAAETDHWEGLGTFGTELGAALWFAGAVAWGARRGATVARAALLGGMFVLGLALIAAALVGDWSGSALSLAMEFGVGLLAVPLIDVVLIGAFYGGLQHYADADTEDSVVLKLGGEHWVSIERE